MVTRLEFEAANTKAKVLENRLPQVLSAKYDATAGRIILELSSHLGLFFSPEDAEGLEGATPEQLGRIEISPSGYGLHFPLLDADLYLPSLMEGIFGSERWMASRMGSTGGKSRSAAKTQAARENGKKGGRPKNKEAVATAK